MKIQLKQAAGIVAMISGVAVAGSAPVPPELRVKYQQVALPPEAVSFISGKEIQARALAQKYQLQLSDEMKKLFVAAKAGKLLEAQEAFQDLRQDSYGTNRTDEGKSPLFQVACEVDSCVGAFGFSDRDLVLLVARAMTNSLTPGCIYFGGTDWGRGLPTMLCARPGEPFFVVSQNPLSDKRYLELIREEYGDRIQLPAVAEIQKFIDEYAADAADRHAKGQLAPGEDFRMEDGKPKYQGQMSAIKIHSLMTRAIFERNPTREFYLEESFPQDWMYPHLTPAGVIMKINRKPLPTLPADTMDKDHAFWKEFSARLIGDWVTDDTPVKEIAGFAERTYARQDFNGFRGDQKFIRDHRTQKAVSKMRSSIGGIYAWRLGPYCTPEFRPKSAAEMRRLYKEADFAFRQAFVFCPYSPEAVFRYVTLLIQPPPGIPPRFDDALLLVKTGLACAPKDGSFSSRQQFEGLLDRLEEIKKQSSQK